MDTATQPRKEVNAHMELQKLEQALRTLMSSRSPQAALAGVAGGDLNDSEMATEFVAAAKSLHERQNDPQRRSILQTAMQGWA